MIDLTAELKIAMREKNKAKKEVVSSLKQSIKNHLIDKGKKEVSKDEFQSLVKSNIKITKETIELNETAGRTEISEHEKAKLVYFQEYLPEGISEEDLKSLVEETIAEVIELEPNEKRRMGLVIKSVKAKVSEKGLDVDGKKLSQLVKESL